MSAPFTADDLHRLGAAQQALLSPLDHASAGTWLQAVLDALRPLFEAERGVVTLGSPDGEAAAAADLADAALADYGARYAAADAAGAIVTARPERYYVEEDLRGLDAFEAHRRSPVYTEWYRPHGLVDALGMFALGSLDWVPDFYAPVPAPVVANVLLAGSPLSVGAGAERGRALLALLEPAFRAGVESRLRFRGRLATTLAVLDQLGRPAVVADADGAVLHQTPGAAALLDEDASGVLAVAVGEVARSVASAARGERAAAKVRHVAAVRGRCWVYGCVYPEPAGRAPLVLVSLDAGGPALPDAVAIRDAWGLTGRQAEVAGLLARRLTDKEVAAALGISVHTARRHAEAVLYRLAVHDRRDVAAALVERALARG